MCVLKVGKLALPYDSRVMAKTDHKPGRHAHMCCSLLRTYMLVFSGHHIII